MFELNVVNTQLLTNTHFLDVNCKAGAQAMHMMNCAL